MFFSANPIKSNILQRSLWMMVLILMCGPVWAQEDTKAPTKTIRKTKKKRLRLKAKGEVFFFDRDFKWFVFPIAAYTPETGVLFAGTGALTTRDPNIKGALQSTIAAYATYTLRHQWGVGMYHGLYLDRDRWLFEGDLGFQNWQNRYFGVGDNPRVEGSVYTFYNTDIQLALLRRALTKSLYMGGLFRLNGVSLRETKDEGLRRRRGGLGGNTFGLGMQLVWDNRDRFFWTRKGNYLKTNVIVHHDAIVSDFTMIEFDLDARLFLPLYAGFSVGGQYFMSVRHGDVPFFRHAVIGGPNALRGTFRGRYRDDLGMYAQVEVRSPFLWRFAMVGFTGAGAVAPNFASLDEVAKIATIGTGLRFKLADNGTNLRLDYGLGPDEYGIYFSLGEAF